MFGRYKKIHMVGIGGIGMSGIAKVLINLGYEVSGSDLKSSEMTDALLALGAKVHVGHDPSHVEGADLVVISSAVMDDNSEVKVAKERGLLVIPRADMLAELMRIKHGIAVAGTHGKTSTTAMIAWILEKGGLDPTAIIGGKVVSYSSNAKLGAGEILVAEADESDKGFLKMNPAICVITNIDPEHMERYRDLSDLRNSFVEFANKVPFYGSVVCCVDHPVVKRLVPRFEKRVITYGTSNADYLLQDLVQTEERLKFFVKRRGEDFGEFQLSMPGEHYAQNALAAIAVADEIGVSVEVIKEGLSTFEGIARRFQILCRQGPVVVDDYAHHPAEVRATLRAARSGWPNRRVTAIFQPHRFTRLLAHMDGFVDVLGLADRVVVTKLYSAGERPIEGVNAEALTDKLKAMYPQKRIEYVCDDSLVCDSLHGAGSDEIIVFMGAGSITNLAGSFAGRLNIIGGL